MNAGHNPPLYLSAEGAPEFQQLTCGGLIVGAFRDCSYEQALIETKPGDLLFAYTDGLTEALNRNVEEFGEARIKETLKANAGLTVYQIRDELVLRVNEWCAGAPQYDDLTFVIMKVPDNKIDSFTSVDRVSEVLKSNQLVC